MKVRRYRNPWMLFFLCGIAAVMAGCAWRDESAKAVTVADACEWSGAAWIGDGKLQPTKDAAFYADDRAPLFRKIFAAARKVR